MTRAPVPPTGDPLARLKKTAEAGRDPAAWSAYVATLRAEGQKNRARKTAKTAPLSPEWRRKLQALAEGEAEKGVLPPTLAAGLAQSLASGQRPAFRSHAQQLLGHYPGAPEITALLGIAALLDDDLVEAEIELRRALRRDPGNIDALSNLGLALLWQGRAEDAIDLLSPHADTAGPASTLRVNLASAYLRAGRADEALGMAEDVLAHAPKDVEALGVFFSAAIEQGEIDRASAAWDGLAPDTRAQLVDVELDLIDASEGRAAALRRLEGLDPGAQLRDRLTQKLSAWGEFDSAERFLRQGLTKGEGGAQAFRKLGQIITWQDGDPLLRDLAAEAARSDQPPGRRATLLLSLAKAQADLGDRDTSFATTREGKAIWAEAIPYDADAEWRRMQALLSDWSAETVTRLGEGDTTEVRPIFIVGLPRSGSTLIETILGRHPKVRMLGENPRAATLAGQATPDAGSIAQMRTALAPLFAPRAPGERVTDKLLANFRMIGPLLAAFPKARFLYTDRDYRATGLSIFENPLSPVDHPYSLTLDRIGRHMVNCARMVATWETRFPAQVRRISYEDLVSDPDVEVPKLIEAAGLDWDEAVRDADRAPKRIDTLSVVQARQPISRASVARWTRHARDLAPLISVLREAGLIADEA